MPIPTIKGNLEESNILFLTLKIVNSIPIFISEPYFDIIIKSLDWCRKNKGIRIYAYTILINHLHLILGFLDVTHGEDVVRDFKRYTANQIIKKLKEDKRYNILDEMQQLGSRVGKQNLKVWRPNNWPKAITTREFFSQKIQYTDYNAEHHQVVKDIEEYPYTSYHSHYCQHPVVLEIDEISW